MSPLPPAFLDLLPGSEDPVSERFAQVADGWLKAKGAEGNA